jgi:colicin import membrane protein
MSTASATLAAVGPAQDAVRKAEDMLTALNVRLSIEAQRVHEARALLASLRADLARATARAEQAGEVATADQARADALVRWAYETGGPVSWMTGLFAMQSMSDFTEGESMLAQVGVHAGTEARAATAARETATKAEAGRRSITASVDDTVAQLTRDGNQMQAAADAQQQVLSGLRGELQHRLAVALAARAAASHATNQAAQAKAIAAAKAKAAADAAKAAKAAAAAGRAVSDSNPNPDPSTVPQPSGGPTPSQQSMDNLIYSIWGQGTTGDQAECIAQHESGDDPNNRNPSSGSAGLFQLMPFWWDGNNQFGWRFDPYDAQQNAVHAHLIWERDGWTPWTTMHYCA